MAEDTFMFDGHRYGYRTDKRTRDNERRVEVPLALHFIQKHGPDVVEVGNVTRHYHKAWTHTTIDLNEKVPDGFQNYENADVFDWRPKRLHTGVLSISTLEHTVNPPLALETLLNWGNPSKPLIPDPSPLGKGKQLTVSHIPNVLVTMPLGYYVKTDFQYEPFDTTRLIFDYPWPGCDIRLMQRITADNQWREISVEKLKSMPANDIRYHERFPKANVIGVWMKGDI